MKDSAKKPATIDRRRFLATVAAGSAALIANPALAAAAASAKRVARRAAPPLPPANPADYEQQRASTLATLKILRGHPLPPGGDLAAVFHPVRPSRKKRP